MRKPLPILYNVFLLTAVNLLMRFLSTTFQVHLSGKIGAEGIGLLQLVLSTGFMAMTAGMAGIRTTTMYLVAEELGKPQGNPQKVLRSCCIYSLLCSCAASLLVFFLAPVISQKWIGNPDTAGLLRMYCLFLPISCLCGVFTGFYTANKQIITLSIVEIGEQLFSIGFSWTALHFLTGNQTLTACRYVILGSCLGSCLTLGCLIFFLQRKKKPATSNTPISRRLLRTAVPLALADDLRAGISTAENMLVPKRLAFYPSSLSPLADFGMVCGMVFPVIMFPAAILFSLNELLIPELARCGTAGSKKRIQYLAGRSLRISLLYGTFFCGLIFLLSDFLCMRLYHNPEAAKYMRIFSLLIPMLYCDSVTDAMTKGLGQQKICVRYNIITSVLDLLLLYTLLPKYGLAGYFLSFLISHALNFVLSLRRLLKITHIQLLWYVPLLAISALLVAIGISSFLVTPWLRVLSFSLIFLSILSLLGILRKENFLWFRNLLFPGAQE